MRWCRACQKYESGTRGRILCVLVDHRYSIVDIVYPTHAEYVELELLTLKIDKFKEVIKIFLFYHVEGKSGITVKTST
jgi:hypothetical protein